MMMEAIKHSQKLVLEHSWNGDSERENGIYIKNLTMPIIASSVLCIIIGVQICLAGTLITYIYEANEANREDRFQRVDSHISARHLQIHALEVTLLNSPPHFSIASPRHSHRGPRHSLNIVSLAESSSFCLQQGQKAQPDQHDLASI
jgi:hypothetical protein